MYVAKMNDGKSDNAAILAQYERCKLADSNEAATRLKVIDSILFDVLGWTRDDVEPEERVSEDKKTTWADYVVRTGMTAFVVEAKKIGASFDTIPQSRRVALRGKIMEGELGGAIIQARDYARKLGIPFAVVTNGDAWIIFPASRVDQVSFQDSSAIVFPSIASVLRDDFVEFFETLSRQAVINGALENDLLGRIENQIESRRLNSFFPTGFSKINRHSIYPLISDAVTSAFSEDIVNDPSLIAKMYVPSVPTQEGFAGSVQLQCGKRCFAFGVAPYRG